MASVEDRVAGALYGMFAGDALAFPLHWYYDQQKLKEHRDKYYGGSLDKFYDIAEEIRDKHPNSGGYPKKLLDGDEAPLVSLIKEEHKPLWATENIHWNATLTKGQNSNTAEVAKLLVDSLSEKNGKYDAEDFTKRYIDFFQKHQHNDLYFEGIHQGYFKQLAAGKGPLEAGKDGETCLSGHTLPIPLTLLLHKDRDTALAAVKKHLALSHRSDKMFEQTSHLANLLLDLLDGKKDAKAAIAEAAKKYDPPADLAAVVDESKGKEDLELYGFDRKKDGKPFSIHCYNAVPGLLYLAFKYFDSPKDALIANANLGGDNTDRGSVLGAVLGAAHGTAWLPADWKAGLVDRRRPDLDAFVQKFAKLAASK